jgi:hypothetical protein
MLTYGGVCRSSDASIVELAGTDEFVGFARERKGERERERERESVGLAAVDSLSLFRLLIKQGVFDACVHPYEQCERRRYARQCGGGGSGGGGRGQQRELVLHRHELFDDERQLVALERAGVPVARRELVRESRNIRIRRSGLTSYSRVRRL